MRESLATTIELNPMSCRVKVCNERQRRRGERHRERYG
jgi:hypothetical protein